MNTAVEMPSRFSVVTDKASVNQALFSVTHGLYVLTASHEKLNGQIIDALMQVTNMPPRIAIGIGKKSLTYEMIAATAKFGVSVIDRLDPRWMAVIKHFGFQSGRTADKFADTAYEMGEIGVPILPDAKAFFECTVDKDMSNDLGTHMLYVADVVRAGTRDEGAPLTYTEYRDIRFHKR